MADGRNGTIGIGLAGWAAAVKAAADLTAIRNSQLDGWRAFAVLGVMWLHWVPAVWRGHFPFEIGLFFFLTLTGFLITRILLRERTACEEDGGKWHFKAYVHFQKRRMMRILVPCYAAMLFAIIVGAPDIRQHWLAYFGHWSNFHMAFMEGWPSGTAHYWTLAIQVQFYLVWPLVVFLTPRKLLAGVFLGCVALAPVLRMILAWRFPEIHHSEMITFTAMDYFGVGALLALAIDRGMKAGDGRLNLAAMAAFAGYIVLYVFNEMGRQVAGFCHIQQTLVSVAFAGLISATLAGFGGFREKILNHPAVQHVGRLSFGLYLFHTPVPLFLGFVLPWLWFPFFTGFWQILRLGVFGLTSWGLAWLCWRYLETRPAHGRKCVPAVSAERGASESG
jgi:peptidoglycan/LPS O-acetylase OafA/YrhL